jgi:hypothetical protein
VLGLQRPNGATLKELMKVTEGHLDIQLPEVAAALRIERGFIVEPAVSTTKRCVDVQSS